MKILLIICVSIALLVAFPCSAEHGCQTGFIPVFQGNQRVCVADYNLPSWKSDEPAQPAGRWVDRWGAIAYDPQSGIMGWSTSQRFKRSAVKAALKKCEANGGRECISGPWFVNTCAAAVSSAQGFHVGSGASQEAAEQDGIQRCDAQKHSPCRVEHSACSLAVVAYPVGY